MIIEIKQEIINNISIYTNKNPKDTKMFLNNILTHMETIKQGIQEQDYFKIHKPAHQIKGNCAIHGLNKTHKIAKELESQAKAQESIETIEKSFKKLIKSINKFQNPQR